MLPFEMRLGREVAEEVEQKGFSVFRNNNGQPYALFKLKDMEGSVTILNDDTLCAVYFEKKKENE